MPFNDHSASAAMEAVIDESKAKPVVMTPRLALDLRLRFLESLVSDDSRSSSVSLARRISRVEAQLKAALDSAGSTDAIRRFVQNCEALLPPFPARPVDPHLVSVRLADDANAPLLSVAPVPINPPDQDALTVPAKVSLILEAEHDIRALERDLREVETLHQRGVVEAGRLAGKLSGPSAEMNDKLTEFSDGRRA